MNTPTDVDVAVVGSGGGGLVAALTASHMGMSTAIFEKSPRYGGTTAASGGVIWVPCNRVQRDAGIEDSLEDALAYWTNTVGATGEEALRDAYLRWGPELVEFLIEKTPTHFQIMDCPDYWAQLPGGKLRGRGLEAAPARRGEFGAFLDSLQPPYFKIPANMMATTDEGKRLALIATSPGNALYAVRKVTQHLFNKLTRPGRVIITNGQALMAYLRKAAHERGIPLFLDTPADELVIEDSRVVGVVVTHQGKRVTIRARHGVVLAAGGFSNNNELRERHHSVKTTAWTVANPEDTGDALSMATKHGAAVDLMDQGWWMPMMTAPGEKPFMTVFERAKPGLIMVNQCGQRFVNEAAPYQAAGAALIDSDRPECPTVPSWFIIDSRYLKRYSFGPLMPRMSTRKWVANGFLLQAPTVRELAQKAEIDPGKLEDTVRKHNQYARDGHDPEFGRGDHPFDRNYADASVKPNPCLAPIERPPFFAAAVWPGDIGTKGGLVTDEWARVLDEDRHPIDGLYAVGNSTASLMGLAYPGPGATVGPSMVMAYAAVHHAAKSAGKTRSS